MHELKMVILPSETETYLWGRNADRTIRVRATLPPEPKDMDALPHLLEALGGFLPIRAALVVPERAPLSAMKLYPGWFTDVGGVRYDLQILGGTRRESREWWGR